MTAETIVDTSAVLEVQRGLHKLKSGDFSGALKHSVSALELCSTPHEVYEASILAGKASFALGDNESAEEAFEKATELDAVALPAWEGKAETEVMENNLSKAVETYRKLLRLAKGPVPGRVANVEKAREYLWRLADVYDRMACFPHAEAQLRELMEMDLTKEQRLEALCFLADIQMKVEDGLLQREIHARMQAQQAEQEKAPSPERPKAPLRSMSTVQRMVDAQRADEMSEEGGLARTLQEITDVTMPAPRYAKYHERHLQRHLSLLGNYPPRSAARQEKRINALRACKRMIESPGCSTPFPFEAAIWLWEETEELYGGSLAGLPVSLGGTVVTFMPQSQNDGRATGTPRSLRAPSYRSMRSTVTSPRSGVASPTSPRSAAVSPRGGLMRASMGSVPASPALHATADPGPTTDLSVRRTSSFSTSFADLATALSTGMLVSGSRNGASGVTSPTETEPVLSPFAAAASAGGGFARSSMSGSCFTSPRHENGYNRRSSLDRLIEGRTSDHSNAPQQQQQPPMETADSIIAVCINADANNGLVTSKVEECGLKLAHQFPWAASAYVAVGLALRRRELTYPDMPSSAPKRKQIMKSLKTGVERGADSASGWLGLAELQYQLRQYQASYDTGVAGLAWSVRRRQRGHETLTQFALSMRLIVAKALRRLRRLDEAEYAFKVLAGWVTEGDSAFGEMSGSTPKSIHQQALRGIAKVLMERGDTAKAKWQYEKILGKALLGRGPAEHWAHSEYAWIAFNDGDLQTAQTHLEKALEVAAGAGCSVTDWEISEHHFKLGRVLWAVGGESRADPEKARHQFELAAREEGHAQAAAFAWLGNWEMEVAHNGEAARELYNVALDLEPAEPAAVEGLRKLGAVADMERVDSLSGWAVNGKPWTGF